MEYLDREAGEHFLQNNPEAPRGKVCLICRDRNVVMECLYMPDDLKSACVFYALCQKCGDKPDIAKLCEDEILASSN